LATNIQHPISYSCIILVVKCPPKGPSCSSFITICDFIVVKHHHNLLSWPIMYNTPFFSVKGFTFLTNFCFCCTINLLSICPIFKNYFTSLSHSGFVWNELAYVVWSGTYVGSVISNNLNNACATTWVLPSLYTIVKSYYRNNNNHRAILLETCGLLIK
jgi:hypothetical protein